MSELISDWAQAIQNDLHGPIVVLGASGFVGANLLRYLLQHRKDVIGTYNEPHPWRLEAIDRENTYRVNLLVGSDVEKMLDELKPRTIFDCVAYGAYSFQEDRDLIYRSNFLAKVQLLELLEAHGVERYVHAGTSSEYGENCAAPRESDQLTPNSNYAASKAAISGYINYFGKTKNFPCVNLRLYAVYGPLEDSSRLVSALVMKGLNRELPEFVNPKISRDFVYVDDVCQAFVAAAVRLTPDIYGESFNIGSGTKTTIEEIAWLAKSVFEVEAEPSFTMSQRKWDVTDWYSNSEKAQRLLGWKATTSLGDGLKLFADWMRTVPDIKNYQSRSKKFAVDVERSVSAVIACYKDAQAIPFMYQRLKAVFLELGVDHEIIFVNDNSPDDTQDVIRRISEHDSTVIGISHSRNFGSQSAFRSGMEIASKNSVVLLDGDLQDPPELIRDMVRLWREGYEVIYGRRVKREATRFMSFCYKLFYVVFEKFSYIPIPRDAGDFSLIERRVVEHILTFPERDFLLRGVRAFAGFRHTGVDYVRPERMFGVTTNSLFKNIGWAKKGIFAYSNSPLNFLSTSGIVLSLLVGLAAVVQIAFRIFFPELTPKGFTTLFLVIGFFGAFNLLAIAIVGEYLGKVLEEVKRRPHFIRRNFIRYGHVEEVLSGGGSSAVNSISVNSVPVTNV